MSPQEVRQQVGLLWLAIDGQYRVAQYYEAPPPTLQVAQHLNALVHEDLLVPEPAT